MKLPETIYLLALCVAACSEPRLPISALDGTSQDGRSRDAVEAEGPPRDVRLGDAIDAEASMAMTDASAEANAREDVAYAPDETALPDAPSACHSVDVGVHDAETVDHSDAGEPMYANAPVPIARLMGGPDFMLATACDGSLWAWGDNSMPGVMQPGDSESDPSYGDPRPRPQRVVGIANVRGRVRGGQGIGNCVIAGPEGAGSVYCWGRYTFRALGESYGDSWDLWRYPRRIGSVSDVIRASGTSSVIRSDLRSWGFRGHAGESWHSYTLPPGSREEFGGAGAVSWVNDGVIAPDVAEAYFEQGLQRLEGIVDIDGDSEHSCVLTRDGRVRCWGENDYGAAGNFSESDRCGTPRYPAGGHCRRALTVVAGVSNVVKIACGPLTTCAVQRDGTLWCWGYNKRLRDGLGSIGDGQPPSETCGRNFRGEVVPCSRRPVQVAGLRDVVDVALYGENTCALTASGVVYCWGQNDRGLVADGTREDRSTPTPVRWN